MTDRPKGLERTRSQFDNVYKRGSGLAWIDKDDVFNKTKSHVYLEMESGELIFFNSLKGEAPAQLEEGEDVLVLAVDERGWVYRNAKTNEYTTITGMKTPVDPLVVNNERYLLAHTKRGYVYYSAFHKKYVVRDPKPIPPSEINYEDENGQHTLILMSEKGRAINLSPDPVGKDYKNVNFIIPWSRDSELVRMFGIIGNQASTPIPKWLLGMLDQDQVRAVRRIWGRWLAIEPYSSSGVIKMKGPVMRWGKIEADIKLRGSSDAKRFKTHRKDDIQTSIDAPSWTVRIACKKCGCIFYVPLLDKRGNKYKYPGGTVCYNCDPWVFVMIRPDLFVPMREAQARVYEYNRGLAKNSPNRKAKIKTRGVHTSSGKGGKKVSLREIILAKYKKEGKIKIITE
jgi:hypothetical protein